MTSTGPRPQYSAAAAVAHALAMRGRGVYRLGTGNVDTGDDDERDCFGFAFNECYGVRRHRPGFNRGWVEPPSTEFPRGRTPSVEDDLNCNSAIEDADHAGELFERLQTPMPGAMLVYPTIRINGRVFIGHAGIVVGVGRCAEWDHDHPCYALLDVVQCRGPDGKRPGIIATDGSLWDHHDEVWPKPEHRTAMLRVKP